MLALWEKNYDKPRWHIKKQRCCFAFKGPYSKSYGFSCRHVSMWQLDHKEGWPPRNWCFWTMVLEKTLESPLGSKEIQPVHPKGNQPWIFIGRTDAETEAPIIWLSDVKSWLIGKDPDAGKNWRQEEKRTTEDEMVGWHRQLDGHKFDQNLVVVIDREAWHAAVHGVTKLGHNWTWTTIFFSTIFFNHCAAVMNLLANSGDATDVGSIPGSGRLLEKEMAIHSNILA